MFGNAEETKPATPSEALAPQPETGRRVRLKHHIQQLEQETARLKADLEAERDKRLRLLAEYDNYRRRTQSEYAAVTRQAGERIILRLLPVLDDFERLLAHQTASADAAASETAKGAELIQKKLVAALAAEGLAAVESTGTEFNAELHEAVARMPAPGMPEGTIIAEAEKGYRLTGKIIRHAKVVVAAAADEEETAGR